MMAIKWSNWGDGVHVSESFVIETAPGPVRVRWYVYRAIQDSKWRARLEHVNQPDIKFAFVGPFDRLRDIKHALVTISDADHNETCDPIRVAQDHADHYANELRAGDPKH